VLTDERSLPDHLLRRLNIPAYGSIRQRQDHALIPAFLLENSDAKESQLNYVILCVHTGEPGQRIRSELSSLAESNDDIPTVKGRKLVDVVVTVAVLNVRKHAMHAAFVHIIQLWVVREFQRDSEFVTKSLSGG
jgi:hypothetical protein